MALKSLSLMDGVNVVFSISFSQKNSNHFRGLAEDNHVQFADFEISMF
jgi:hypothetical protein